MKSKYWNILALLSTGTAVIIIYNAIYAEPDWFGDYSLLPFILFFIFISIAIIFGYLGNRVQPERVNDTPISPVSFSYIIPIVVAISFLLMLAYGFWYFSQGGPG